MEFLPSVSDSKTQRIVSREIFPQISAKADRFLTCCIRLEYLRVIGSWVIFFQISAKSLEYSKDSISGNIFSNLSEIWQNFYHLYPTWIFPQDRFSEKCSIKYPRNLAQFSLSAYHSNNYRRRTDILWRNIPTNLIEFPLSQSNSDSTSQYHMFLGSATSNIWKIE